MPVETPHKLDVSAPDWEIDAGVIDDARKRQQWHRRIAASVIAAAVAAGALVVGFMGGGGSGAAHNRYGHGSTPSAGAHAPSHVVATLTDLPSNINVFGLLAPGVGWVVNGAGFYVTWDGGRRWRVNSKFGLNRNRRTIG